MIYFLSASDRINYGDLLFPIIFAKFVEREDFRNYSIVSSDLSHFGAMKTKSYIQLIQDIKRTNEKVKVVIGGGEVLFADWSRLFEFINMFYSRIMSIPIFFRIEKKIDLANKILSNGKVKVPFAPKKIELSSSTSIYYSSVGGGYFTNTGKEKHIAEALKDAKIISVRDLRSKSLLKRFNLEINLIPDTAILVSDLIKMDEGKLSFNVRELPKNYFFLQLGINKGPSNLKAFHFKLIKLAKTMGLKVILCPIGLAAGHEDDKILKALSIYSLDYIYIEPKSIYDIIYLINNSRFYLGTSLHGMITAQSYNVPFFGLNKKIKKLDNYIKTWIDSTSGCVDFSEIQFINDYFNQWDFEKVSRLTSKQKVLAQNNILKIIND